MSAETPACPPPPKSGYELERHLKALRSHPAVMKQFLLQTPPKTLPKLLRHCLTTELVLAIAGAFSEGEEGEAAEGAVAQQQAQLCFLQALVKTPRFDVTMMFLAAGERLVVEAMFGAIEAGLAGHASDKAAAGALRPLFGLK